MPLASRLTGRDDRAALLGAGLAPLFDDRFVRSCDLYEAYVDALAGDIFERTGLARACETPRTPAEAAAAAGLAAEASAVPVAWLCARLAGQARLARDGSRYRLPAPLPAASPDAIRAEQARHDPACLPSYDLAAYAAQRYPAVLSGNLTGEQVLADPEAFDLWRAYFANANPIYAISNVLGAMAATRALVDTGGAVLELGAGLGSGAEALLDAAPAGAIATYLATDSSPLFLRRAQRALLARHAGRGLAFAPLDFDRPFAEAGIAPASQALVYGVNVLHVARDLAATLAEIRTVLAPGGRLVFAECVRPHAGAAVHVELVFNLLRAFRSPVLHPRWRPCGGFLTPEQWRLALAEHGFADVEVLPDVEAIRDAYPSFVVAAITARAT